MKILTPIYAYCLEVAVFFLVISRLILGRDVQILDYFINLSTVTVYVIASRLCVPVLIKGEIYSLLGKKISSDDEKLISFFFGVGLILFYFVVFHLRIEK
ncbi:hypothetical protein WNY58_01820 [Neptuniibacter pectenicola]|uniref:Uncharacterized protein n=1 Tax=Neptuniibacter pectenicola TaxID=1806669 RepID=A0ABU9TN26_9GAMM